jgi:hypothetical protein
MKVGQIFDLPKDIIYEVGKVGIIRDTTETILIAKYEAIEVDGEVKGKVIVTYGHKRKCTHNH